MFTQSFFSVKLILFVLHLPNEITNGAMNEGVFGCFFKKVIIPKCSGQLMQTCSQKVKKLCLLDVNFLFCQITSGAKEELGPDRTMWNFVCLRKYLSTQCHFQWEQCFQPTKFFTNSTKLQRCCQLALEAYNLLSGRKIYCSSTDARQWQTTLNFVVMSNTSFKWPFKQSQN